MKMYFDYDKKYSHMEIKDLDSLEGVEDYSNFIGGIVNQMQKDIDDMWYQFLTKNGYKIKKPYDLKQLETIKNELAKQDKFLDYLEYTEFSENGQKVAHHLLPFFNCLSDPLNEDARNAIIEKWKVMESDKNE